VISADIAVPEHERAVSFYASILCTGEAPLWREDLMNNLGIPVIGLGARIPEYEHLPLQWMPHIQVDDVATSVERALSLGGKELMHGKDDDGQSQWAVLLDPNGAAFGIIPVVEPGATPEGSDSAAPAGRILGLALTVSDPAATRDFYSQVVGWTAQDTETVDQGERHAGSRMLDALGQPIAGIFSRRSDRSDLPEVWIISLPVGDLAESVRRAGEEGGKVIQQTHRDDGALSRAVIQDPVGACCSLVQSPCAQT
jgi:predicted enzyme related to lactoylglutathione lyase